MIVIAGSDVDTRLQRAADEYRAWRGEHGPKGAGQPAVWEATKADMEVFPLFPHVIYVIADASEAAVAFAFRKLFVENGTDVALYLPSDRDRGTAAQDDAYVNAVARFVREATPISQAELKKHTSGKRGGWKAKITKFLHMSATVPETYTSAPFTSAAYTTLSRRTASVYLCSTAGVGPWVEALGYNDMPFRDNVVRDVLRVIDACNDVLSTNLP